jgi:hypothetical protein
MYTKRMAVVLGLVMSAGMLVAQEPAGSQAPASSDAAQQAGQTQASQGQTMQKRAHRERDPEKMAEHLGKKLNLSADQVAQIKPILADRQQQMSALRADTSLSQQDKRAKFKAVQQDSKTKLEAVMNDSQKQQFEQMMAERREKRQEGKSK